jgi:hypothetical protein
MQSIGIIPEKHLNVFITATANQINMAVESVQIIV